MYERLAITEIVEAIKNVMADKYFISSSTPLLLKEVSLFFMKKNRVSKLTTTERKILRLIANNRLLKRLPMNCYQ
jgi:DNA-binding NarL/FixJ family response regulator